MRNQVEKILQMATLEEGKHEFNFVPLDAHKLIQKAVSNVALQVSTREGTLSTLLGATHSTILGDSVHLQNVIHNLLDNAIKYSASRPNVRIETRNTNGQLIIVVGDRGIGIAREYLDKVFDKYFRVPTGNLHDVKGFGLGLSYVKLVVQAHGGNVSLVSTPGQGTTVSLNFPLA
jgi:two-component system phosphate regulon sensor histidine kinase PhoR